MNRKTLNFLLVLLIKVLILSGVAFYYKLENKGITVFLQIRNRDPMTPLRGDYLTLSYIDISFIPKDEFEENILFGDFVYIPLEKEGKLWRRKKGVKISKKKQDNKIFIKGVVSNLLNHSIEIKYGIENYYIPLGSGRNIQWSNKDYAEVFIDNKGNAKLKKIYLNGNPFP